MFVIKIIHLIIKNNKNRVVQDFLFSVYKLVCDMKHDDSQNILNHVMKKQTIWLPNRSDTNRAIQAHAIARNLKFWI